jgi:hypothetical protein
LTSIVAAWVLWAVLTYPTSSERYIDAYLETTETANIWQGKVAMNKGAKEYMLEHYAAFDPSIVHYEYDLPGAVPWELGDFVTQSGMRGGIGGPVVLLGQISTFSRGLDANEWVVQLLPLTEDLAKTWHAQGLGGLGVLDSTGSLDDLYPVAGYDQETAGVHVYARVHLRPFDVPQNGAPMVVRGFPIAYGRSTVANGRSFDTIYIAGSSGRVGE